MKIIRYQNPEGKIFYGAEQSSGQPYRIEGDIFGDHAVTSESAQVSRLLAPI